MSEATDPLSNPNSAPTFMRHITDGALAALSPTQTGFIISMRTIDPSLSGENLRNHVAEMFPPAHLFCKEIADMASVWMELRAFLDARGAPLQQHSSRRVILTLAHGLYQESEDRNAAIDIANDIVSAGRRRRQDISQGTTSQRQSSEQSQAQQANSSEERVAHNVAMRLRDNDKKFSGDIGECWMEFVDEYQQIARDYKLTATQKLQYLHNILSKDASRFYLDRVAHYATTFQQAVEMIDQEYNSIVRQTRVKNYLNNLRVSDFEANGDEISVALMKVYKAILKLSRQVPVSHRGDAHRIEFLRRSVVGYNWSHEPLSRVATHNLSFQQVYGELEAALQLDKEARIALLRDKASNANKQRNDDIISTNFAGQGRYSRGNKSRGETTSTFNPLSIAGCFNCGDPGHIMKNCPRPLNVAKAAASKIEYLNKKKSANAIHLVLASLCQQLDGPSLNEVEHDDAEIFMSILTLPPPPVSAETGDTHDDSRSAEDEITLLVSDINFNEGTHERFEGACVDSGAQRTLIGKRQADLYASFAGTTIRPTKSKKLFRLGSCLHPACGIISIRLPITKHHFAEIIVEVIEIDIPFLLGLDLLTRFKIVIDFDDKVMRSKIDGTSLPITRKMGHAYIDWTPSILYTEQELRRIHRHFHHPLPDRLTSLIKRAHPNTKMSKVYSDLEKIKSTCDVCQREADAPHRFRVTMPSGECIFNKVVSLDLMKLDNETVLHAVDRDTRFSAACFLTAESTSIVWEAFLTIWVAPYVGFPDTLALDQGPQFTSNEWVNLARASGITIKPSGVESHNALGAGERYHSYLRRIYNKVRASIPSLSKKVSLALAVKASNDTAGPSGLVPSLLVFGVMPRLPIRPAALPSHVDRMRAAVLARKEMIDIVAKQRLETAANRRVPNAADSTFCINDEVLMYREKPIGK